MMVDSDTRNFDRYKTNLRTAEDTQRPMIQMHTIEEDSIYRATEDDPYGHQPSLHVRGGSDST